MIILFPILALVAGLVVWRTTPAATAGEGWHWFAAWSVAGLVFTFNLLAGFSIGLFILPLAAALLIWSRGLLPARSKPLALSRASARCFYSSAS
jgi:hypothetical protein